MIDTFIVIILPLGTYSTLRVSLERLLCGGEEAEEDVDLDEERLVDDDDEQEDEDEEGEEDLSETLLDSAGRGVVVVLVMSVALFVLLVLFTRHRLGLDLAVLAKEDVEFLP